MGRIKKRGFQKREQEVLLSELSLEQLEEENRRLHRVMAGAESPRDGSEEEDVWFLLHQTGELIFEINRRKIELRNEKRPTVWNIEEGKKCRE